MNTLVVMGTSVAYGYSAVAALAPGLLAGREGMYFDVSTVIVTLILLGRLLEARARGRTGAAIERLAGLRAKTARVVRGGEDVDVPVEDVAVGDLVVVRPGEKVPVDGVVVSGESRRAPGRGLRAGHRRGALRRGPDDRRRHPGRHREGRLRAGALGEAFRRPPAWVAPEG